MSIDGRVLGRRVAVPIVFRLPGAGDLRIECIVDTGFSGMLTLPQAAVRAMSLPYLEDTRISLADDRIISARVHAATLIWNGVERTVRVIAIGKEPHIGVGMLFESLVGIEAVENGAVTIRRRKPELKQSGVR